MVALNQARVGETQEVKWIMGNSKDREEISKMGISEGSVITVISSFLGNVVIACQNMRYGISKDLAHQIKMG